MTLRVAFQMDALSGIAIRGDSTFALMLEAERRGHEIFYYTPDALTMLDGEVFARGAFVSVSDEEGRHFEIKRASREALPGFHAVLLRQDPPFDMGYITTTHLLERIHPKTLVANDPASVRNAPEKLLVTAFGHLTPPTLITRSAEEARAFRETHGDIIVKPLYGNGGSGVFRLAPGDMNEGSLIEMFLAMFKEPFIVQAYLPEVRRGDKRIILVDGEPAGAINRVPAAHETRSNMHVGGRPEPAELTARDHEICAAIGPELKRRGLLFAGIDVIGDYLTEINVTSPTGIREIKRFGGADIAALIWNVIERKISQKIL